MGNARARGTLAERIAQAKARPVVEKPEPIDDGARLIGGIERTIQTDDKGRKFIRTRRQASGTYVSRDKREYTYDGVYVRRVR